MRSYIRNVLAATLVLCCPIVAAGGLLVVAPHPDDDLLIAAGLIANAKARGDQVKVVFMTNGDYDGQSFGALRQGEAVNAQLFLGTVENDLIFLGYPDGGLPGVYTGSPNPGDAWLGPNGRTTTYASRGLGGSDYHTYQFGAPATYNRPNLIADLQSIITTYLPDHIVTTAEHDQHSDHATTFMAVRDAVDAAVAATPGYNPALHKTIVWAGHISLPPAWPAPLDPGSYHVAPGSPPPGMPWAERESIEVPSAMQTTAFAQNPKYQAIAAHASQGGVGNILARFIHRDEVLWQEPVTGATLPPVAAAAGPTAVAFGASVQLNASGSRDPGNAALTYTWRQTDGPLVLLTGASTATPSFQAPVALQETSVTFELVVNNGVRDSLPDLVTVRVVAHTENIAPLATATASTENTVDGQFAQAVTDGVVDGWPGDYTREWSSNGERAGAWLQLQWEHPVTITRVVLHDRPNDDDFVTGGTLTFSDGSSVAVPALLNGGGALPVALAARTVTWVRFTVNSVSSNTWNVGLAEVQVFGELSHAPPVANAGLARTVIAGHTVQLDGSRSSAGDGAQLTFQWQQTAGPGVALSSTTAARPTFVAPTGPATLTFQLVVNDGMLASSPATVQINVLSAEDANNNGLADAWESLYGVTDPNGDPDNDGLTNQQEHDLGTSPADAAPAVSIAAPASINIEVAGGTVIHFSATASDAEDGNLSASIQWHSSLSGPIGSGATLDLALPLGTHIITATVVDSLGAAPAAVPSRTIHVVEYVRNGDVDGNGTIDTADVLRVQQYLSGARTLTAGEIARGDLYPPSAGDGELELSDLLLIERLMAD